MTKQVNYSVLIGAIASNSAGSNDEWIALIKQALNDIEDANEMRIRIYQELGGKLWEEIDASNIRVSNEVTIKSEEISEKIKVKENPQKGEKDDRSLQGWSDIILGKRK